MDILALLIWIIMLLICHVLLVKFLELRQFNADLLSKITKSIVGPGLNPGLELSKPEPKIHIPKAEPVKENFSSMEEELMNYVYNKDPETKKISIGEPRIAGDRLTPMDATNVINTEPSKLGELQSYAGSFDQYSL